jgi:hypothetical protein
MLAKYKQLLLVAALYFLPVLSHSGTHDNTTLQPFDSTYKLKGWGVFEIERTVTLSRENSLYTLRSTNKVAGLASLIGYGPVVEETTFVIFSGQIRPLTYSNVDQSGISGLNDSIEFDWINKVARSQRKGKIFSLSLQNGVLDPLTVELRVRLDLENGLNLVSYRVHEVEEIRTYRLSRLPMEIIQAAGHQFKSVHLVIDAGRKNRQLHYWLAPDFAHLPVQLKQFHKGKVEAQAILMGSSLLP